MSFLSRPPLVFAIALTYFSFGQVPPGKPITTVNNGLLDEIRLYGAIPPAQSTGIGIRPFSATDADLAEGGQTGELPKETKDLQERGPRLLQTQLVATLKDQAAFSAVSALTADAPPPAGALVVEGKFTLLDPGSRAKRYFVGFGAGKSGVQVAGSVKGADGKIIATFVHKRIGVMGVYGGDSTGKLQSDAASIGEDIAKFLSAWAKGKKLK